MECSIGCLHAELPRSQQPAPLRTTVNGQKKQNGTRRRLKARPSSAGCILLLLPCILSCRQPCHSRVLIHSASTAAIEHSAPKHTERMSSSSPLLRHVTLSLLLPLLLLLCCCWPPVTATGPLLQVERTANITADSGNVSTIGSDGGSLVYWIDYDADVGPATTFRTMNATDNTELAVRTLVDGGRTMMLRSDFQGHIYYVLYNNPTPEGSVMVALPDATIVGNVTHAALSFVSSFDVSWDGQYLVAIVGFDEPQSLVTFSVANNSLLTSVTLPSSYEKSIITSCTFDPTTGDVLAVSAADNVIHTYSATGVLLSNTTRQGQGTYSVQALLMTASGWLAVLDWDQAEQQYRMCVVDVTGVHSECVDNVRPIPMGLTRDLHDQLTAVNLAATQFVTFAAIPPPVYVDSSSGGGMSSAGPVVPLPNTTSSSSSSSPSSPLPLPSSSSSSSSVPFPPPSTSSLSSSSSSSSAEPVAPSSVSSSSSDTSAGTAIAIVLALVFAAVAAFVVYRKFIKPRKGPSYGIASDVYGNEPEDGLEMAIGDGRDDEEEGM